MNDDDMILDLVTPDGVCKHTFHQVVAAFGSQVGVVLDVEDTGMVLVIVPPDMTPESRILGSIEVMKFALAALDVWKDGLEEESEEDGTV